MYSQKYDTSLEIRYFRVIKALKKFKLSPSLIIKTRSCLVTSTELNGLTMRLVRKNSCYFPTSRIGYLGSLKY